MLAAGSQRLLHGSSECFVSTRREDKPRNFPCLSSCSGSTRRRKRRRSDLSFTGLRSRAPRPCICRWRLSGLGQGIVKITVVVQIIGNISRLLRFRHRPALSASAASLSSLACSSALISFDKLLVNLRDILESGIIAGLAIPVLGKSFTPLKVGRFLEN